jgi:hypothetical protein
MEHPDVQKLENRLKKVWHKRDIEKARDVLRNEANVDEQLPPSIFYCSKCKKDYIPKRIYKVISYDWNTNQLFRYWRSKHCKRWNTRLITNKMRDKFFIKSPSVIKDRRLNKLDMIQPGETGFNMLYGRK